jgi:hypothetical protein
MWVVNVRLEGAGTRIITAESEITDDDGMSVAHRSLSGSDCDGLARAVGIWASLVLETEMRHQSRHSDPSPPPQSAEPDATPAAPWPPAPVPQPSPEPAGGVPTQDWYVHHGEKRNLEIGLGGFLMTGAGAAVAGPSPFIVVEGGNGVFLRPAVLVGQSVASLAQNYDSRATVAATRFDTCLRIPGLYNDHRGMQLDTCAGADLGFVLDGSRSGTRGAAGKSVTVPNASIGPSMELRGEMGSALSATVRGVTGVNLFQQTYTDASGIQVQPMAWIGRVEVALSWGLR